MKNDAEMIDSGSLMRGWCWSLVMHAAVWGIGVWVVSQKTIVTQPTLQWEVSLVNPLSNRGGRRSEASSMPGRLDPVTKKSMRLPAAAETSAPMTSTGVNSTEPDTHEPLVVQSPTSRHDEAENLSESAQAIDATAVRPVDEAVVVKPSSASELVSMPHVSEQAGGDRPAKDLASQSTPDQAASLSPTGAGELKFNRADDDFGWLMRMLWSRVTELKRYPHEARMNQWEGRVIVRVVINAQGQLLDASVAMGSGYAVLDRAALEAIKESCPLTLSQPLGRERIVLRIPIQYKLSS